jgi:hypothetical protein
LLVAGDQYFGEHQYRERKAIHFCHIDLFKVRSIT